MVFFSNIQVIKHRKSTITIPEQQRGHEDNSPAHFGRWISWVPEKPVELEALGHEDRLRGLLQQVLKVPLVGVGSQVVH